MKTCLIVGDAECVFEDLIQIRAEFDEFNHVVAVKRVLARLEMNVDTWVSLHSDQALKIIEGRFRNRLNMDFDVYMNDKLDEPVQQYLKGLGVRSFHHYCADWGGSSGLYAIQVALLLYSDIKIVLAGIPINSMPRYGTTTPWAGDAYGIIRYQRAWYKNRKKLRYTTRSMSGWTKSFLGRPTKEWLISEN